MRYDFDRIIPRLNTNSLKWDKEDASLLPMWVADMDFEVPQPVIDAMIARVNHGIFGYSLPPASYYEAIVNWQRKRHNWQANAEWLVHCPGIVPGLHFLVQAFTEPGDKVLIQTPVYYPFISAPTKNSREIVANSLTFQQGRYTIDFEDLEKKASDPKVKLFILCSPHNPVGRVWTKDELIRIGNICLRHNVLVISDEIHADLVYRRYEHTPFAAISPEFANNSITCVAPSKTFNLAGLQTSSLIIPNKAVRDVYSKFLDNIGIMRPNAFGIVATQAAFNHGEEWLEQLIDYLQGNLDFLKDYLVQNIPMIKVIEPEATYLLWLDCRLLGLEPVKLHEFILKDAKVFLDEGYIFGEEGNGFERINIACPRATLAEGLNRIRDAIARMPKTK